MGRQSWIAGGVLALAAVVAAGGIGRAQEGRSHRVVFEVTGDAAGWESVLNNVENLRKALGDDTEVKVVAHGKGLGLVQKTNTAQAERIARVGGPRVTFEACENTMRRLKVSKEDLLPNVVTVDSGVAEVVRLQEAGWSYIKSGS